jgi:type IV pilus secretin PilQ/predicted competence protein
MSQKLKIKNQRLNRTKLYIVRCLKLMSLYTALLCFSLLSFAVCASAKSGRETQKPQEAAIITGIDIQENAVAITADKPFIYTIYKPGDPYKMVVDLPEVSIGPFKQKIISDKAGITEIMPSQIEAPTLMARLEILLQTPSSVDRDYKNNMLTIKIKDDLPKAEGPSEKMKPVLLSKEEKILYAKKDRPTNADAPKQTPQSKATEISDISFETSGNSVKVVIKGNGPMIPNVFPLDDRIVIDISDVVMNATIPSDVVSPVRGIRSGKHDDKIRLVIDIKEKTTFDVAAIGGSIIVTLKNPEIGTSASSISRNPVQKIEEGIEISEKKENGRSVQARCETYVAGKENVNLDFQDQDIVPILRLFADISGCNLFIHPDVKGKATMKFRDVPWNKALDTLLKTFGLGKIIEGNIIRVAPNSVLALESDESKKVEMAKKAAELELAPLERKTYRLVYANAEDVKAKLLGQVRAVSSEVEGGTSTSTTGRTGGASSSFGAAYARTEYDEKLRVLSRRGTVMADKTSNTLTVEDVSSKLKLIDDFIAEIDQPIRQVLIEARIVEVNTNVQHDFGIQWGTFFKGANTLSSIGGFSGLNKGTFTGNNFLVDFPGSASAGSGTGITFGVMNAAKTVGLDVQLSAFETLGTAKVVTNPKIMTMDRQEARILQGKSIPVRKLTAEGTVSTEFKDVTMELVVTPSITREKTLDLAISIKKEELDPTVPSIEGVPGTDKKEAKTKVMMQDGETIVIGGLYKINTSDTSSGVPGLMNVPVLKWLFSKKDVTSNTTELMIFITPRIVVLERKE